MTFLQRVKNWYLSYKAAERVSKDRSQVQGEVQDARFDCDTATWSEVVRKSRSFERNNGLCSHLADLFEQYTVGAFGQIIIPASQDEETNKVMSTVWDEWCRFPDLSSRSNFATIQSMVSRRWWFDGGHYILKTHSRVKPYRPRIQLIESHRVGVPGELVNTDNIIDGHELDQDGRTVRVWALQGLIDPKWSPIDASNIIHVTEPERPGMIKQLPFCYPVVNEIVDLTDLERLEMLAAKDAAEKSNVILNEPGEIPKGNTRMERLGNKTQTGKTGAEITEARLAAVKQALGGRTIALKKGEDFKQYVPSRPSAATADYWDYLIAKICLGHGLPKTVAFPTGKAQGTVARGDYDQAATFFRCRAAVLAVSFLEVYHYVMGWHVENDPRLRRVASDWKEANVLFPRAVNVDVGRNSAAMLAELAAGATTYEDIYGALGKDWRNRIMQRGREALFIRQTAKQLTITEGEIRESLKQDIQQQVNN
jgi:capsid protein